MTVDRAHQVITAESLAKAATAPPRVCVAVPSHDQFHANFGMALGALMYAAALRRIPVALTNQKGSLVAKNRDNAVAQARQYECDWLLFLDSDMTFPPTTLERLLAHDKKIVGATYPRRTSPHQNLAKPLEGAPLEVTGLVEVAGLPTGCMLIHMSVFEDLKRPYFRCGAIEEGDTWNGLPGPMTLGEDYNFCHAARAAGHAVWMDTQLSFELVHWGEIGVRLKGAETANDAPADLFELIELPAP